MATGPDIQVGCVLDDGSYVEGHLGSFSIDADDQPDRDLILSKPIGYRPPGADELSPYESNAVCFSAGRIVAMFVSYLEEKPVISSTAAEGGRRRLRLRRRNLRLLPLVDFRI